MEFTAREIAGLINGTIEGDESIKISSFGQIETARKSQLAFLANIKYEDYLYSTRASIIIVNDNQVLKEKVDATLIRVPDAYSAFATILTRYQEIVTEQMQGIQEPSYISPSAKLGDNVFIGAFAYLGADVNIGNGVKIFPQVFIGDNVTIDAGSILYAGVRIYHDTVIGKNVIIHSGTVIGSDGFGFAPQENGSYKKIPQIGNVIIEDNVEIGANCAIDRSTIGATHIKEGSKLDNLIQIAHNVEIGDHSVIAGQVGISGSTKIGRNAMIGGQVGIAGHLQLGDGVKIAAQSGVLKSVENNVMLGGSPATDLLHAGRVVIAIAKLPELLKKVARLEKQLEQLKVAKEKISSP